MLRPNPLTGALEEDGLPDPGAPLRPPILQATPESTGGGAPAPAPAASPITIVAPPEESHRVETSGPQTTKAVASPEAKKAMGELEVAHGEESSALSEETDHKLRAADQAATLAEQQAQLAAQRAAQEEAARKAHAQRVAQLTAEKEKRRAEEERLAHPTTYWEDKSVPSRILGGLLLLVGGAASGLARQPNGVIEVFRRAEDEDRQRKLNAFKNAKEFRELAEKDIAGAQGVLGDELARITQNEITRSNVLVKNADALAKRTGLPHVLAEAQKLKAHVEAENAEKRVKLGQHYDQTIQSGRTTTSDTVNVNKGGKTPDLTALDAQGKPYGTWRTLPEAEKGRDAQSAITGMRGSLDALNAHVKKFGNLMDPTIPNYLQERANRKEMVRDSSTYLQKMNDAGILNPGEQKNNESNLATNILKGGDAAVSANTLMMKGLERKYEATLKGKAVQMEQAPASPGEAPKPKLTRAEATSDLARVNKRLQALPKGSPDRARLEALRQKIIEQGDGAQ